MEIGRKSVQLDGFLGMGNTFVSLQDDGKVEVSSMVLKRWVRKGKITGSRILMNLGCNSSRPHAFDLTATMAVYTSRSLTAEKENPLKGSWDSRKTGRSSLLAGAVVLEDVKARFNVFRSMSDVSTLFFFSQGRHQPISNYSKAF